MSQFHLAHFNPEELEEVMHLTGDKHLEGTSNVIHLENLEHMIRDPHMLQKMLHHIHEELRSGHHSHHMNHGMHGRRANRKDMHPALMGDHTKAFLDHVDHLMGGGQPHPTYYREHHNAFGFVGRALKKAKDFAVHTAGHALHAAKTAASGALNKGKNLIHGVVHKGTQLVHNTLHNVTQAGKGLIHGVLGGGNGQQPPAGGAGNPPPPQQQNPPPPPPPNPNSSGSNPPPSGQGASQPPLVPPVGAKRGGRIGYARHFHEMRHHHAPGGGLKKIVKGVAKAGIKLATKAHPELRVIGGLAKGYIKHQKAKKEAASQSSSSSGASSNPPSGSDKQAA